ncbi:MAG: hypothetical protein K8823_60 [Cenarchaeum symbiont of Oopsacas minuta]|nr:hypothetical protein [Cenarchaeum symbiont of Oopsacas minuta]
MQDTLYINVSAINYEATSTAIATVLDRMQDIIHGNNEFRITDSEAAFGWHFFVVAVNVEAIKKLATLLGKDFQCQKGKGIEKKFLTWIMQGIGDKSPRFKLAIKEEMESSKFGIF